MKNPLLVVLIGFILSLNTFSQTRNEITWWTVDNPTEEFTAKFPTNKFKKEGLARGSSAIIYKAQTRDTYFYIVTALNKSETPINQLLALAESKRAIKTVEKVGRFEATRFAFLDEDSLYHEFITVQGEKKFYIFQALSCDSTYSSIHFFFSSISFGGNSLSEKFVSKSVFETHKKDIAKCRPRSRMSTPKRDGNLGTVTRLKLLKKPFPRFNYLASIYGIKGPITVRATFSANGKVEEVTPVRTLPFGITKTAVEAIHAISFTPRMVDGKAVSVTKTIQYYFSYH